MGIIAPTYITVNPSFTDPGIILPYTQSSGAFDLLPRGKPDVKLSDGDLVVYMKKMDVRTRTAASQATYNMLPSCDVVMSYISTPTYMFRNRAEYDHHDIAAAGRWGVALAEAQRLAMRQGHFQLLRTALLYGMNPANGEGVLNTPGATAINLPPDSNNKTTVVTYDNGQMAFFLVSQMQAIKTLTNQMGEGRDFTICGPQRVLGQWAYQDIVQLTQFQRVGAGSENTKGLVDHIMTGNEDTITWAYDDTLIGKGAGGNDAIIIIMTDLGQQHTNAIDTNEFAKLMPSDSDTAKMYMDRAAPTEIPVPLAGGALDIVAELRSSSGWVTRPEAVTVVSMQFS